jgi:hypothetical protein
MRKQILVVLVIMILAAPVLADVNQQATLNGGDNVKVKSNVNGANQINIKINQEAWNIGPGDINQDIGVHVTGNVQILNQDSILVITDPELGVNNEMKGVNLINVDLNQYGNNSNTGNVSQGIDLLIDNNVEVLNQDVIVTV